MSHRATVELSLSTVPRARTVERALSLEIDEIEGERSRTRLERTGKTLSVTILADDPTALRAAKHTWFSLLETAEAATATAATYKEQR